MTSRERMLTALSNRRPDRLPCQVHGWMTYYLSHYLGGMDEWQAFERFGMDYAIYVSPRYEYDPRDMAKWETTRARCRCSTSLASRWCTISAAASWP
jgi:uroporphyrinogen decarboxylase